MSNDWKRVGWFAAARRRDLGLTQPEIAKRGGPSAALVRQVERGAYSASMQSTVKRGYESALRWESESIDDILDGGEPSELKDEASQPSPANVRPDRDSITEASVRARVGEDGRFVVIVETLAMTTEGEPGSRAELRFWPGEGRAVRTSDLMPIAGDAHRAALRQTYADERVKGGGGNGAGSTAQNSQADELSAAPDELEQAAAKTGNIEQPGEFNT